MEAGVISPDVQKACGDDNYASLVHLQNEIPFPAGEENPPGAGECTASWWQFTTASTLGKVHSIAATSLQAGGYWNLQGRVIGLTEKRLLS